MATIQDKKHRRIEELSVSASRAFVESGLHGIEAEVVVALDGSPRMAPLYANGLVQEVATSLLALAMKFDDDGIVPIWTFDDEAHHLGEIKRQDYNNWVRAHVPSPAVVPHGEPVPAARYAPLIDAIGRRYFPKEWSAKGTQRQVGDRIKRTVTTWPGPIEPRPCAIFAIIVTCGDCADSLETTRLLRRASHLPIFWQFAGLSAPGSEVEADHEGDVSPAVAGQRFKFLRGIDKLSDTHCDCAGFFEPAELTDTENLYEGLLNELPRWLALSNVKAMLQQPAPPAVPDDGLDALLMTLPPVEAAKREHARVERERRRQERATMATLELEQAAAWPTIRPTSEIESEEEDPVIRARGEGPPRRTQIGTVPYTTPDENAPMLPPRRPTVSFSAFIEPAPADQGDDESTVETAVERLARIRARRNARRGD